MKNILLLLPLVLIFLISCTGKPCPHQIRIEELTSELAQYKMTNEESTDFLTHIVYFDLIDDLSKVKIDSFSMLMNQLRDIELIKSFKAGAYDDVDDSRALSQYEFAMILQFKDKGDYKLYQQDSIHQAVKNATKHFLAGPPATYDF